MFPRVESEGSRRKQTYTAAAKDGKPIVNEGEKTIKFVTDDGQKKKAVCQIARVNKILASIAGICDKDNEVNFWKNGGDIVNCKTGKHKRRSEDLVRSTLWTRGCSTQIG